MKKEYSNWDSFMTEILEHSVKEHLSVSERGFFRSIYNFGQRLKFTTPKQDYAILRAIKRAKGQTKDRAAIQRKRDAQEIRKREKDAKERNQAENNDVAEFNRELAGVLGNTGDVPAAEARK